MSNAPLIARDDLSAAVIEDVMAVMHGMLGVATPALCQLDVSMSQVKAMLAVSLAGEATIGAIGQTMGVGLPAASATVERLVNMGWVNRAEDPLDRRRTIVSATAVGQGILDTLSRLRQDVIRGWLIRMADEDLATLARGIAALRAASKESEAPENFKIGVGRASGHSSDGP